jgi:cereblon
MWCLETPEKASVPAHVVADEPERRLERPILCRRCQTRLSDASLLFPMDADRIHRVFANPSGLLLEIVTARGAENVQVIGPPTTDFTWYPGYAWEVAYCSGCQSHVGWAFGATDGAHDPAMFYGLLKGSIVFG